jgi:hypothetical protein
MSIQLNSLCGIVFSGIKMLGFMMFKLRSYLKRFGRCPCSSVILLLSFGKALFAAELQALVRDGDGHPVKDAVVVAVPQHIKPTIKPGSFVIDQVDKEFVNGLLVVPVGANISFPNRDNIRHHVYSFSPAKTFELPLYSGTPSSPVSFDKPGPVVLGCNIHDWMLGFIYVVESPFYGTTNIEGQIKLENLPADDYVFRVWHPYMKGNEESTIRIMTITDHEHKEVDWEIALKPDMHIRRAPIGNDSHY